VKRIARHVILSFALAGALSACGDKSVRVSLVYTPTDIATPVPGAESVSLDVVNQDKRTQFRDRIGTIRGSLIRIVSDNDASDLVRGAVEQKLKGQGFVVAPGGLILTVELQNFYCDYGSSGSASIGFTLRARDAAGLTLYSRYYEGSSNGGSGFIFNREEGVKMLVEKALAQVIELVGDDKALQQALLSSKSKASAPRGQKT